MDVVLLVLRIVLGGLLVGHGTQKLFGWFDGPGLKGASGFMEKLGYRPPDVAAAAAGASEAVGGALLVIGLATPLAAAMVVGAMVNAIVSAHWSNGVWAAKGGYELPLLYAVTAVTVVATGPGLFSLDAAFGVELWGGTVAVIAAVIGVVVGALVLASRRVEVASEDEAPAEHRRAA